MIVVQHLNNSTIYIRQSDRKAWEQVPQKHLHCVKVARIGRWKPQKAWKQEIRRKHNSNPLQHHEHVQLALIHYISIKILNWNEEMYT